MSPKLSHPPHVRVLRTALALLLALPVLVPVIVQVLEAAGIVVNEAVLLAVAGVAVLAVTEVRAVLAGAGRAPLLRTLAQVLAAVAAVVATGVADLGAAGVDVDATRLLAMLGAVTLLVSTVQNVLEARGVIPELGVGLAPAAADAEGPG